MKRLLPLALGIVVAALAGCGSTPSSTPTSSAQASSLDTEARAAVADLRAKDPGMDKFINNSYAYAVFPDVTSGAFVVGGAHGNGEVFKGGRLVGYADVSKANVGAQIGGQSYSQFVFFQSELSYAKFTSGTLEFDAKASAVAASAGASASADYENGVVVFTNSKGGLMAQAAIGGQKFRYIPMNQTGTASEK